jgi:hypothetical protein
MRCAVKGCDGDAVMSVEKHVMRSQGLGTDHAIWVDVEIPCCYEHALILAFKQKENIKVIRGGEWHLDKTSK